MKPPFGTILQDIAVSDLALRPAKLRAKVLQKRRHASMEVQLYNRLKMSDN